MKKRWLTLLLLGFCGPVHADRDIVYSARYYAPPGSHKTSHFHIYRISPDGTGKTQLTFGVNDEFAPRWSADGTQILFATYPAGFALPILCRMRADGRNRRTLGAGKGGAWPPEPAVPGYRLDNTVADDNSASDKHRLVDLKTGQGLMLIVPDHDSSDNLSDDLLLPTPGQDFVYAANDHNSTVGVEYEFYRLRPGAGTLHRLTEGQFLAWSPNGLRFCVAPGKDTTAYEKRRQPYAVEPGASAEERSGDEYRQVWSAPLYVRAASGGKMRQLTPRLSYVTGADWRKEK